MGKGWENSSAHKMILIGFDGLLDDTGVTATLRRQDLCSGGRKWQPPLLLREKSSRL